MLAHDPLILRLPGLFHLLQLGFANDVVEPGAELARGATRAAHPIARDAHRLGQILGWNHEQRDRAENQQFGGGNVEH